MQYSGDEGNFEEASSSLDKGLESCRSVVASYRALLGGGETPAPDPDDPAERSQGPLGEQARE